MTDKQCYASESIVWNNIANQTIADVLSVITSDILRAYNSAETRMIANNGTFKSFNINIEDDEIELTMYYDRPFNEKELLEQVKAKQAEAQRIETNRLEDLRYAKAQVQGYLSKFPELKGLI